MKKLVIILLFLILIPISFGEDWVHNSENLLIDLDVSSDIIIMPRTSDYSLKNVVVNLSFFPKDDFNQEVLSLDVKNGKTKDDSVIFEWKNPSEKKLSFGLNPRVRTYNKIIEVKDKIDFPIKDLDKELEIYIKPSETIDSDNEEIVKLASELVNGEDDVYKAVFKIADWTKSNIEYNLSTLTAEASQKASWVLENRKGVCDEITTLFIAMLRAVGIPAKFVSGVSYTNSELFEENWGAHGWAEVYFPNYGFVPFDVTYGEFGFIDATHIKMKDSVDSASSSTQYEWLGRNVDLETKGLEIKAELIEKNGKIASLIDLKADAIKKEAGFGSYNLIQASVKNLEDYYISEEVYLSRSDGIEIIGENRKNILLKPKEEKNVFWIVKVSEDLDSDFIYTFPFIVGSLRNATTRTSFNSESKDIIFSLDEIENILKNKIEEEEKKYSREIDLNCSINKEEFYVYEDALVKCDLKNIGNIFLEDLEVCFEAECEKFDLGIMQDKKINFSVNYSKAGERDMPVKARNNQVTKFNYIKFNVLDEPKIKISNLEFPESVLFDDKYKVVFILGKESYSNPVDIEVIFEYNNIKKIWDVNELSEDNKYEINLQGSDLNVGRNKFKILVNYKDKNNREYKTEQEFYIELVNVTLWQRVLIFFNNIEKFISGLSLRSLVGILFVASFMFVFVVLYVFRRSKKNRSL